MTTTMGKGEFIYEVADGYVYVADRENHRVQVFDAAGKYETQWNNMHRPCALYMDRVANPLCYIGELGPRPFDQQGDAQPRPASEHSNA